MGDKLVFLLLGQDAFFETPESSDCQEYGIDHVVDQIDEDREQHFAGIPWSAGISETKRQVLMKQVNFFVTLDTHVWIIGFVRKYSL